MTFYGLINICFVIIGVMRDIASDSWFWLELVVSQQPENHHLQNFLMSLSDIYWEEKNHKILLLILSLVWKRRENVQRQKRDRLQLYAAIHVCDIWNDQVKLWMKLFQYISLNLQKLPIFTIILDHNHRILSKFWIISAYTDHSKEC